MDVRHLGATACDSVSSSRLCERRSLAKNIRAQVARRCSILHSHHFWFSGSLRGMASDRRIFRKLGMPSTSEQDEIGVRLDRMRNLAEAFDAVSRTAAQYRAQANTRHAEVKASLASPPRRKKG